jgi:hypothetical protein
LGKIWKEAVMHCFKPLTQHLLGDTEEDIKYFGQDVYTLDHVLIPGPSEYKAGVLTTEGSYLRACSKSFGQQK